MGLGDTRMTLEKEALWNPNSSKWHYPQPWCVSSSVVSDSLWPMDCSCQAPLSMGFSREEYWSGLPFSPGDLPNSGIEPTPPASSAMAGGFFTVWARPQERRKGGHSTNMKRDVNIFLWVRIKDDLFVSSLIRKNKVWKYRNWKVKGKRRINKNTCLLFRKKKGRRVDKEDIIPL